MSFHKSPIITIAVLLSICCIACWRGPTRAYATDKSPQTRTGKIPPEGRPIAAAPRDSHARKTNAWTTGHYIIPSWSLAVPGAAAYDHTPAFSFAGASAELRIRLNDRISAGVLAAYQQFNKDMEGTRSVDHTTISSDQERRTDLVPILAIADFYMLKRRTLLPWIGLGIGAMWSSLQSRQFAPPGTLLHSQAMAWQFSLAPRMGMLIMMRRLPLSVSVQLHIAPPADAAPLQMMTTFNLGLGIPL